MSSHDVTVDMQQPSHEHSHHSDRSSEEQRKHYAKLVPSTVLSVEAQREMVRKMKGEIKMALTEGREASIQDIGPARMVYNADATLSFKDVAFSVQVKEPASKQKVSKNILAPCSGHFEPSQLVAIMGPSGCGKSTLLDILADKKTSKYEGEVLLNGRPRDRLFDKVTAYIPQTDVMPTHMTVRETLLFAQRLRMNWPRSWLAAKMRKEVKGFVDIIIETFGLTEVPTTTIGTSRSRFAYSGVVGISATFTSDGGHFFL